MADGVLLESMLPLMLDISGRGDISVNIRRPGAFTIGGEGARQASEHDAGALRHGSPSRPGTRRPCAGKAHAFGELWYENAILSPTAVDTGTISRPVSFTLVIWNSHFSTETLALEKHGWEGISDIIPSTLTLGPLCWRQYEVTVGMNGPAAIGASLKVRSSTGYSAFALSGIRGIVWPFRPQSGLEETWEWKTEVQEAWDRTESRLALRLAPRRQDTLRYVLQGAAASQMDMLLYELPNAPFSYPLWELQAEVESAEAGDESIACPLDAYPWQAGDMALLWQSERQCELVRILSVGEGSLAIDNPLSFSYRRACIMPCTQGSLVSASRQDRAVPVSEYEVSMSLPAFVLPWSAEEGTEQYEGHDVWEIPLYVESSLKREMSFPKVTLDNGLGPVRVFHAAPVPASSFEVKLYARGQAEVSALRAAILRRQGCMRPFYLSSRRQDIVLARPLQAGGDTLTVYGFGSGVGFAEGSRRRVLRMEYMNGTVIYRTIIAVEKLSVQEDAVRLSEALSSTEDTMPEDIRRISFLTLCRLSSDTVRFVWKRAGYCEVSLSIQEVMA